MWGLEFTFWTAVGLVLYTYVGYPVLVGLLALWSPCRSPALPPDPHHPEDWPFVSLIISAYQEETIILERIHNALVMDYPADRLEILIGCDGQEDRTADLVRLVDDSRVRLLAFPQRRGKPSVLNDCAAAAKGDLLAFSDANTFWDRDALKSLVRHFRDPQVGGVCGQLLLIDSETGENVDGLYWRYENFLKRCEGTIDSLLGFNGANYAIRRTLWQPIPAETIVDDFLIGMRIQLQRRKLVYEDWAIAEEETAPTIKAEFHRRARIGAGGFQSLVWLYPLLSPAYGTVAFAFWSHKVLRWLCPLFLCMALVINLLLVAQPLFTSLLAVQLLFYASALIGRLTPGQSLPFRMLRLSSMFVGMNAALAVGFWRWIGKRQSGAWSRTARSTELIAR